MTKEEFVCFLLLVIFVGALLLFINKKTEEWYFLHNIPIEKRDVQKLLSRYCKYSHGEYDSGWVNGHRQRDAKVTLYYNCNQLSRTFEVDGVVLKHEYPPNEVLRDLPDTHKYILELKGEIVPETRVNAVNFLTQLK